MLGIAARNGILMISHFRHLAKYEHEPFGIGLVLRGASEWPPEVSETAGAPA